MNTVPENWIPFVPVHLEGDNREIQLQRAAMPRILEGGPKPPKKVRPRTVLLREGLDKQPAQPSSCMKRRFLGQACACPTRSSARV